LDTRSCSSAARAAHAVLGSAIYGNIYVDPEVGNGAMRRATALVGAMRLLMLCGTAGGAIPDPLILRDPEHSEEPVDPTVDGAELIHESGVIQLLPDGPSAGEFGFTSWISQHVKLGKTVVVRFYDTAPTPARHFIGDFLNGVPTEEDLTRLAHNEHWCAHTAAPAAVAGAFFGPATCPWLARNHD
jgi:hypothetical protein